MTKPYIVFCNGVFDILHPGHYNFLMYCSSLVDSHRSKYGYDAAKFIIAIDSDKKVKQDKGQDRPIFTQEERAKNLLSINYKRRMERGYFEDVSVINEVIFFDTNEELEELIKDLVPDIMVKSEKWKNNVIGEKWPVQVLYYSEKVDMSTTQIVEKVKKSLK